MFRRLIKLKTLPVAFCVLMLVGVLSVSGYVFESNRPLSQAVRWNINPVFETDFPLPQFPLTDGSADYHEAFTKAVTEWNSVAGNLNISTKRTPGVSKMFGNGINAVFFANEAFGFTVDEGFAYSVTFWNSSQRFTEAKIFFNANTAWDAHRGGSDSAEIIRLALHELGHGIGLAHPSDYGQNVDALMNPMVVFDQLQPDDVAGGQALYGVPSGNPTPTPTPSPTPDPEALAQTYEFSGSVARRKWVHYQVKVPADASRILASLEGSSTADLYAQWARKPSTARYGFRSAGADPEFLDIPCAGITPAQNLLYVSVYGTDVASYSLEVTIERKPTAPYPTPEQQTFSGTLAPRKWSYQTIVVPSGVTDIFATLEGTGDANLFLQYRTRPSSRRFVASSARTGTSTENLSAGIVSPVTPLQPGNWILGVNTPTTASNYNLTVTLSQGPLSGGTTLGGGGAKIAAPVPMHLNTSSPPENQWYVSTDAPLFVISGKVEGSPPAVRILYSEDGENWDRLTDFQSALQTFHLDVNLPSQGESRNIFMKAVDSAGNESPVRAFSVNRAE